ncbi:unnamed protein product [Eruca vesicaria subsp. sativa]|uniref:F-box domain-containing protein n=1 Tax=Eruca vesicaria subsp. sativa TaxID=29727 RepID=A0ABC8JZC0_ERUVS|nr:unnamed protein product [Eruca vesicaria subsp. sativa]
MASFSTLPHDLIKEILYKSPAESLVRLRLTCKQLRGLINKDSFIYEYMDRSPVKFLRIDQTVQIMDPVTRTRSEIPIPDEFQPLDNIIAMFHCDGLMLCRCSFLMPSELEKLALWNPLTRKVSWVDEPSQKPFWTFDYYGIGYVLNEPPLRDYKILKFSVERSGEVEVHIYECMSKSWRTLFDDTKVDWKVVPRCNGVAVKGNLYWLAKKNSRNFILGFDFSDETFKDICFCHLPYYNNYLSCYEGDKLSLLEQNRLVLSPIEVWVSSKLADGNVSFIQYLRVDSPDLPLLRFFTYFSTYKPHPVYCIDKDKLIIACYEGDQAHEGPILSTSITLCEIDKDSGVISKEIVTVPPYWNFSAELFRPYGYIYVPSLVCFPV